MSKGMADERLAEIRSKNNELIAEVTRVRKQLNAADAACIVTEGQYWHWTDDANKKIEIALTAWREAQENDNV